MRRIVLIATGFVLLGLFSGCGTGILPPDGGDGPTPVGPSAKNRLVETDWLSEHLGEPSLVVIDARATGDYIEGHIAGAVSASFSEQDATSWGYNVSYGGGIDFFLDADNAIPFQDGPREQIQQAVRNFGINQSDTVVVYDQGAHFHAARFFWTLTHHGFESIYILNGGLEKWLADGYGTTQEIPAPTSGDFVAEPPAPALEATTDEVFAALSDPDVVIVSGLTPPLHYGSYVAYTVPGHIPQTQLMPLGYSFNADRTWKSKATAQAMLEVVGITPDKSIITYCGGNPLSACMFFSFKYVLEYPDVKNYAGSYLDWITDPRDLPVNTYGQDHWLRDTAWLRWWVGARMQTLMPVSPALAVDVRPETDYGVGHIPWSVNAEMDDTADVLSTSPSAWAQRLGQHGVGSDIEIVLVDETLSPRVTLLFWLLHYLGHEQVSVASEGLAGWRAAGHAETNEATVIAEAVTPIDVAIQPASFVASLRPELRLTAPDELTGYPFSRVWVVSSEEVPEDVPGETFRHVPWTANLTDDGLIDSAAALWALYEEADVPYFSEIVCYSDDAAEATMTYFVLRLLKFPRVTVYVPGGAGL